MGVTDNEGIIIKVFDTISCEELFTLRRGIEFCLISNIAFDSSSDLMAVSSNKNTIHIYDVSLGKSIQHSTPAPTPDLLIKKGLSYFKVGFML